MPFRKSPKTALVLSGGGSRGSYQVGVWKALREMNIKIDIALGTSVGAVNAAMVTLGDFQNAERLWSELETEEIFDISEDNENLDKVKGNLFGIPMEEAYGFAKEILTNGGAGSSGMLKLLDKYIDERKFRKSKIEYGLVTCMLPQLKPVKLYTKDIPINRLHQFIVASASCFPAAEICEIDGKKYIDGGYSDNMPIGMAIEKGAERIIAVDLQAVGIVNEDELKLVEDYSDFKHITCSFDLGNFLSFNPDVAIDNLRYGYLDGLRAFGKIDGKKYSFKKNHFSPYELISAEATADIFRVDGREIYTHKTLHDELKLKVLDSQINLHKHPFKIVNPVGIPNMEVIKNKIASFNKKIDSTTLVAFIAEDFMEKGDDSKFNIKVLREVLNKEILAAQYIVKNNLLQK